MNTMYQTKATATGGRNGNVQSEDGVLNLEVRLPKEMGGVGGAYTNPEQLFAAGYAACFDNALIFIARQEKIKGYTTSKVTATVGLQMSETEGFGLVVNLEVELPNLERAVAEDLLAKAHATCPYSKAIRNNVSVTLNLV
jgi:lipoyl-dependent peroxiredoxin